MDTHPVIIGGKHHYNSTTFPVLNPYTRETIAMVCAAGPREVEKAVRTAEQGAIIMAALPAWKRSEMLFRLAELVEEEADELTDIIIREGGKVRRSAAMEVVRAAKTIRLSAEEAVRIHDQVVPMDGSPQGEGRIAMIMRVPVGVVLAITPFNLPLNQVCHKAGPALAAGNSCIIKPSSATPTPAAPRQEATTSDCRR